MCYCEIVCVLVEIILDPHTVKYRIHFAMNTNKYIISPKLAWFAV